jgi:acetyl esterase/lipase
LYEKFHEIDTPLPGIFHDYFGKDPLQHGEKIKVLDYVTGNFPPAFIMSAVNDFLLPCARPMYEHLHRKGVECVLEIYGSKEDKKTGHVFHLNFLSDAARQCNDAQCEFFKRTMTSEQ